MTIKIVMVLSINECRLGLIRIKHFKTGQIKNNFEFENKNLFHGTPRPYSSPTFPRRQTQTRTNQCHYLFPFLHPLPPPYHHTSATTSAVSKKTPFHSVCSRQDMGGPISLDVQHRRSPFVGTSQP